MQSFYIIFLFSDLNIIHLNDTSLKLNIKNIIQNNFHNKVIQTNIIHLT
jgi:hypothetical protein